MVCRKHKLQQFFLLKFTNRSHDIWFKTSTNPSIRIPKGSRIVLPKANHSILQFNEWDNAEK